MAANYCICRRARREDIRKSMPVWAKDEVLYDADVWALFPKLLEDLMQRDLVSFALIESLPARVPRLLGGMSFIRPQYIEQALAGVSTLPNLVMRAALAGRNPFLSPTEVGKANTSGELNSMTFFGNIDVIDLSNPDLANFYQTSNEGHRFFHFGYSFQGIWKDVWPHHHVHELQQVGMQIARELPLANGITATLMRLTREEALANPYARLSGYFCPRKPRFAFSFGEQRLLEYALLDMSDEETAEELHLSGEAIKKRWRSIYRKVDLADPNLLLDVVSGTARRRTVLHYLRQHLEELRPYRQPRSQRSLTQTLVEKHAPSER